MYARACAATLVAIAATPVPPAAIRVSLTLPNASMTDQQLQDTLSDIASKMGIPVSRLQAVGLMTSAGKRLGLSSISLTLALCLWLSLAG